MEADAQRWNSETGEDAGSKKRRRSDKKDREAKSRTRETSLDDSAPPNIVDTASMIKDGHPALTPYVRNRLEMKDYGMSQWMEAGAFEENLSQIDRLHAKTRLPEKKLEGCSDEEFNALAKAYIENRKRYEAVRDEAIKQLNEEGIDWNQPYSNILI